MKIIYYSLLILLIFLLTCTNGSSYFDFRIFSLPKLQKYHAKDVQHQITNITHIIDNLPSELSDYCPFPISTNPMFGCSFIHTKFILNSNTTLPQIFQNITQTINETLNFSLNWDIAFLVDVQIERNIKSDECSSFLIIDLLDMVNGEDFLQFYLRFIGNGNLIECANQPVFGFTESSLKVTRLVQFQNVTFREVQLFGELLIFKDVTFESEIIVYENAVVMWNVNGELPIGKIAVEESRWRSILMLDSNLRVESINYLEKVTSLWIVKVSFTLQNIFEMVNIDDLVLQHVNFRPEIYDQRIYKAPFVTLRFVKNIILDKGLIDGFSYHTALSIEYSVNVFVTYTVFSNNHVNSLESSKNVVVAKGLNQLHVLYCKFIDNISEHGSVFEISGTTSLLISTSHFQNNTVFNSALNLARYVDTFFSYVRIQNSAFRDNFSHSKGGALTIEKLSSEPGEAVEVYGCSFSRNRGELGGAIFSLFRLLINGGTFDHNTAVNQGGAIFARDQLSLRHSQFVNNSVSYTKLAYCTDNNCIGSGGALSFLVENQSFSSLVIIRNSFNGNSAIRGGAISASMPTQDLSITTNSFENCQANFAGGALFISSIINKTMSESIIDNNVYVNNKGLVYGNDMSSILYVVNWKYSIDGKQYNPLDSNGIKLFPGQVFSLLPEAYDIFNQSIPDLKETSELIINNSDKFQLERQGFSFNHIFISVKNQTEFISTKLTLLSEFSITKSEIPLIIEPCPSDSSLKPANYGRLYDFICQKKPSYDYVIAVAVTLTVVTICFGFGLVSICACFCVKITRKVNYWVKRDKAEKDIEKRLLENEITYMDENSLQTINSTASVNTKKQLSFIISIDQIFPEKKIGEGGSGVVYLGKWHHHPVAIKCLKIEENANSDEIEKEAAMLCRLRHPNIVLFYGVSLTQHKQYLVVEYLERGSLEKYIQDMKRQEISVTFSEKLKLLIDIACGMVYLHSLKIIHRDLKPANILMDANWTAKVCDFGISRIMESTAHTTTLYAGTLFYLAPELLQSEHDEKNKITTSVDVFSFSIIMWQLFFEDSPYINTKSPKLYLFQSVNLNENGQNQKKNSEHLTPFSVLARVLKGERPYIPWQHHDEVDSEIMMDWLEEYMSEFSSYFTAQQEHVMSLVADYMELMKACWCENYQDRPNFETILGCLMILKQHIDNIDSTSGGEHLQDGATPSIHSVTEIHQILRK